MSSLAPNLGGLPDCPPATAVVANGDIFIYVKNDPPAQEDFLTAEEKGTHIRKDPCRRKSLSCGVSEKYLDSMGELFPITRGWLRARGKVCPGDGLIMQTTSNLYHHSFWVNPGSIVSLHSKFKVISHAI